MANSYVFIRYKDETIEQEEYTLFGRTYEQVQECVSNALKEDKSFKVIVFKGSEE